MRSIIGSSIVLVAALAQLGSTDCGQAIRDDGFDLWCGEELCAWKVERGAVMRVASWNKGDYAVELVGSDVAIEQLSPVNGSDGSCMRFTLIANVQDTADVVLNVDVEGDGTVEMSERLPTSHWQPLTFTFALVQPYDGVRFEIAKRGLGEAVVANIGAKIIASGDCTGLTPLDPGPRRNGSYCFANAECASGACMESPLPQPENYSVARTCVGCDHTVASSCGAQVCGLADAFSPVFSVPVECVAPAAKPLGDACIADAECATNICNRVGDYGSCSTCTSDGQCSGGQRCLPSGTVMLVPRAMPQVCGGGQHLVASGAPCASNDDCVSGLCNGTVRSQCAGDGRPCVTAAECTFDGLQNRACNTVGIQGGTCQ